MNISKKLFVRKSTGDKIFCQILRDHYTNDHFIT
jgi:hypothetical protein